jgi:ribosome-binding factor A
MKHRLERVNEVIKRELGDLILRHCHFNAALVTVQQVDVTPDLKHAHVFISVIGAEAEQHQALAQLHKQRGEFQRELGKRIVLKFTPHLHFKLDDAAERGDRILQIISELHLPEAPKATGKKAADKENDADEDQA